MHVTGRVHGALFDVKNILYSSYLCPWFGNTLLAVVSLMSASHVSEEFQMELIHNRLGCYMFLITINVCQPDWKVFNEI